MFYPHPSAPSGFFLARAFFGARDIRSQYLSEKWHWSFRVIFERKIFERYLSEQYLRDEESGGIRRWNWGRAKTSVWVLGKHAKIGDSGRANFSGPKRKLVFGAVFERNFRAKGPGEISCIRLWGARKLVFGTGGTRKPQSGRREDARKLELGPRKLLGGGKKSGVRGIQKESVADKHCRAERKAEGGGGSKRPLLQTQLAGGKRRGFGFPHFPTLGRSCRFSNKLSPQFGRQTEKTRRLRIPPRRYPIRISIFACMLFDMRNIWHQNWGRANIGVAGNQYVYLGGRARI